MAAGCHSGPVDGAFGPETTDAIRELPDRLAEAGTAIDNSRRVLTSPGLGWPGCARHGSTDRGR